MKSNIALWTIIIFGLASLYLGGAAAQKRETKIIFGGQEAGFNFYEAKPAGTGNSDGSFESTTEMDIQGMKIRSKLTGKFEGDVLAEFELVESAAGQDKRVTAKDGKLKFVSGAMTKEGQYKPMKAVFANFHPAIAANLIKEFDRAKGGVQNIEWYSIDTGAPLKVDVSSKKTRSIEVAGQRQIVDVYSLRFSSGADIDLFLTDNLRFAALDLPGQKFQIVAPGFETLLADPTTVAPELSQPTFQIRIEKGVKIEMRDRVALVADIVKPVGEGKYPTILARTPYGRQVNGAEAEWWSKRGYAYVSQDVRGRNDSEGDWVPFFNERKDGYDTIDWIARQPWSDGKVGMIGGSYSGLAQWYAAVEAHPALKCILPQASGTDPFFNDPWDHGVPLLHPNLGWLNLVKDKKIHRLSLAPIKDLEKLKTLPLSKVDDEVVGVNVPYFDQWLAREKPSAFAGANFLSEMDKVKIPALHISGWWDGNGMGTKMNWAKMRALNRKDQWMIYGPWSHSFNTASRVADLDYGPDAIIELDSIFLRWFDHWLKNKPVNWEKQPKVRAFVTGANEWREMSDWPEPSAPVVSFYLSSEGRANGGASVGALVDQPQKNQKPDHYTYDPASISFPKNLDSAAASHTAKLSAVSENVLVYKTSPFVKPLEIGGPIELDLYFSTTAKDTDFFAYLTDIDDQGSMRLIGQFGKIRAKYLSGWDKPSLLQPGKIYRATIALWDTAHQFKTGHRLGLMIRSELFPIFARNLNTGEPVKDATRIAVAQQQIYHDAKRPSALRFRQLNR
jgi:putative CocE/NonD family hydrolase